MADSDGEYVEDGSDDDFMDHQVTSATLDGAGISGSGGGVVGGRPGTRSSRKAGGGGAGQGRKGGSSSRAAWEDVKRSWETVVEGEDGELALGLLLDAERRRRLLRDTTPLQRGIIRHLVVVLDMSSAMLEKDLLPSRHRLTMAYAREFVRGFFEQNPISQLGIVGMRDGVAVRISDLGGNPAEHLERLVEAEKMEPQGAPSLQNALEMCRGLLFHAPSHGTREVLIIFGALLSSDPGDIHETIDALVADRIRVSVVGLSAQVAICAELCSRTNGGGNNVPGAGPPGSGMASMDSREYTVALHEDHFRDLFLAATTPPAAHTPEQAAASLLMMGFPSRTLADHPSYCACHDAPAREGYHCSRCGSRVCRLPAECPVCGLTLILSTHLARSYHHLFPLRNWAEVEWAAAGRSKACFACLAPFPEVPKAPTKVTIKLTGKHAPPAAASSDKAQGTKAAEPAARDRALETKGISESGRYACEVCGHHFCLDCDIFAHEVIHNCPGCQSDLQAVEGFAAAEENGVNGEAAGHANGTTSMVVDG